MNLNVRNLSFAYGEHEVLRDISFDLHKGEFLSVLGPNGVGKSTLFRCVLNLLTDYTGSIASGGVELKTMSRREMSRRIAYIPQINRPAFGYTVLDTVLMGTTRQLSMFAQPGKSQVEQAMAALEKVGAAALAQRDFTHLSGGEQQLVLVARAIAQQAEILVMDEPTSALDYGNQLRVMEQLRQLTEEGYMILQSTHNPEQAFLFSDQVVALKDGCVLAAGAPEDVLTEQRISDLYSADVEVHSIHGDKLRVCVPKFILKRGQNNE